MRRAAFFVIIGLGGAAILIWLGMWQVQRLAWKEDVISQIEARITAAPVDLPAAPTREADNYRPVTVTGTVEPEFLRVLISQKDNGAAFRIIARVTESGGTPILVDLGVVPTEMSQFALTSTQITLTGNLQWPQETDVFTPAPEDANNLWFARDVPAMSDTLLTRSVLVVARDVSPDLPLVTPLPVDTALIPNNHLQYAITWFSLAAIWLLMSLYFVLRRPQPVKG